MNGDTAEGGFKIKKLGDLILTATHLDDPLLDIKKKQQAITPKEF